MKILIIAISLLFCTNILFAQKNISVKTGNKGKIVTGIATYYSDHLDGTRTASGQRFSNSKMTAASNFFKLHSWVRVTSLLTGKSIIVYINDRMHHNAAKNGLVIDLSKTAAQKLRFLRAGKTKVKIEHVSAAIAKKESSH